MAGKAAKRMSLMCTPQPNAQEKRRFSGDLPLYRFAQVIPGGAEMQICKRYGLRFFCIFGRRSFQKRCEDVFESLAASSVSSIRVTEMKSFV